MLQLLACRTVSPVGDCSNAHMVSERLEEALCVPLIKKLKWKWLFLATVLLMHNDLDSKNGEPEMGTVI